MSDGSFQHAEDCSLKNVIMNDVRWNPAEFARCDFSGAALHIRTGSYTRTIDCKFRKADLSEADLDLSTFISADFRGAKLVGTKLEKCDFTGANLAGADLSRADLRNAKFTGANLSKAKFKNAILSGANFKGATIDGAEFAGANVAGAIFTGIDVAKAKHLSVQKARTPGPAMLELAKLAGASKKLSTSIELALGTNESVTLYPSSSTYAGRVYYHAQYSHHINNGTIGNYTDAPSFEQGMLNLADLWSRGTPEFETVQVEAKHCPLRGKELRELAVAAWHEACDVADG
jgi:uncharacterized protein YjbI with pentapeptide repeats